MPLEAKTRKSVVWTIGTSALAAWLAAVGCSVDLSKLRPNHKDGSGPLVDARGNSAVADTGSPANDAMTSDTASATDLAPRPDASADSTTVEAGQGTTPATDVGGQAADGPGPPNDAEDGGPVVEAGGSGGTTTTGGSTGSGGATGGGAGQTGSGGTTGSGGETATGGQTSATGGSFGHDAGPDAPPGTGGAGGNSGTGGGGGNGGAGTGGSANGGSGGGGTTSTSGTGTASQSAGCGKTPTLASGAQKISSSGNTRNYMIRIPANYDNKHPYPLVFAFHWDDGNMNDVDGGGTSGYTWSYYGLREQADNSTNSKMIFVAPNGNGGWPNSNGQDLTFVDDMLKLIQGDLCVDTTRIFSMGFSYGGGMSYAIACVRAKVFRAVAVYCGAQLSGCTGGTDPIAYIGIHGISDRTYSYSGGESLRNKFVTNNGCTAQTPPKPSAGSLTHICTSYDGCRSGYPVRWCAFDGGHTPGMVDGGGDDGAKTWTKGDVWKFFTQF